MAQIEEAQRRAERARRLDQQRQQSAPQDAGARVHRGANDTGCRAVGDDG